MGRLLIVLSFLFAAANAFAAVPGNAPILTIAAPGQQTQALSIPLSSLTGTGVNGVFSLYGYGNTAGPPAYFPLIKNGVAYQVTAGKSAYCFNIRVTGASGTVMVQLVSDTVAITEGQTAALTSGSWQGGASALYVLTGGGTSNLMAPAGGGFVFAASRYAGFQGGAAITYQVSMECFEQ